MSGKNSNDKSRFVEWKAQYIQEVKERKWGPASMKLLKFALPLFLILIVLGIILSIYIPKMVHGFVSPV